MRVLCVCRRALVSVGHDSFGTCLIVGGTGALGAAVAIWLAQSGWTALLLAGRRGVLSGALSAALRAGLLERVAVTVTMCDAGAAGDGAALTAGM